MCGLFGVVKSLQGADGSRSIEELLLELGTLSESRGTEASGLAVATANYLGICKGACAARRLLRSSQTHNLILRALTTDIATSRFAAIGHARMVTNGSEEDAQNNHPFFVDEVIGIHNGIIVNHEEIRTRYPALQKTTDVDSEVLFRLLGLHLSKGQSLPSAVASTFALCEGAATIACLLQRHNALLLATNTGSMYVASNAQLMVFLSEQRMLEQLLARHAADAGFAGIQVHHLRAGSGLVIDLTSGRMSEWQLSQPQSVEQFTSQRSPRDFEIVTIGGVTTKPKVEIATSQGPEWDEITREQHQYAQTLRRCSRCILPETMPFIRFDPDGVCNYCENYRHQPPQGIAALLAVIRSQNTRWTGRPASPA